MSLFSHLVINSITIYIQFDFNQCCGSDNMPINISQPGTSEFFWQWGYSLISYQNGGGGVIFFRNILHLRSTQKLINFLEDHRKCGMFNKKIFV